MGIDLDHATSAKHGDPDLQKKYRYKNVKKGLR
jgi:hypothetical protein